MKSLKNTDLKVSNIALGTDCYGTLVSEEASFEMLDFYKAAGGNLIDTAEAYARWFENGEHASELLIGKWLKSRGCRNDIIISTKGGFNWAHEPHHLTYDNIISDLEGSLKRLGTDCIDIYWLHRDCEALPVSGMMDALNYAVDSGKVRYIGVSNWTNKRFSEANAYLSQYGKSLFASQMQYSAASPNYEENEPLLVVMNDEEYTFFKNCDYTVFAFASQAKGFFSKYIAGGADALSEKAYKRYYNEETLKRVERLKKVAADHNISIGAAAISALCSNYDFDTIPIIGCKNLAQLEDSLSGGSVAFSRDEIQYIFGRDLSV